MKTFFQQKQASAHFETVGKTLTDIQNFDIVELGFLNQLALVHPWNGNVNRNNILEDSFVKVY